MSWFGKIVGGTIGLMLGGPIGAMGGAALGHFFFDKQDSGGFGGAFGAGQAGGRPGYMPGGGFTNQERIQASYFVALFSMFGKIAKADGLVTRHEGDLVVRFIDQMGLSGQQREFAIRVFNEAKDSPYSAEDFARQFYQLTAGNSNIHLNMIDMLFQVASADGTIHELEEQMIRRIADVFRLGPQQYDSIRSKYVQDTDRYYKILGCSPSSSDEEIRTAYRKLVREFHPDTVTSKGLPEEFVKFATRRFREIQEAYEEIKKERNM